MTRDNNFRRENTVDQNRLLGATSTRDLNSFKHFLGPKNKTLRILKNGMWEIKKIPKIYDSLPFDWLTGATLVTWLDCGWFVDAKVL